LHRLQSLLIEFYRSDEDFWQDIEPMCSIITDHEGNTSTSLSPFETCILRLYHCGYLGQDEMEYLVDVSLKAPTSPLLSTFIDEAYQTKRKIQTFEAEWDPVSKEECSAC